MYLAKSRETLADYLKPLLNKSIRIGFVPTMGALHKGHLTLVEHAKRNSDFVVVSIFVNRRQFNHLEDFKSYPRSLRQDLDLLQHFQPDVVFLPEEEDLFSQVQFPDFPLYPLDTVLEGAFRPGHFRGVAEVLWVFFTLIRPHRVFMGQKDLQQCAVVERLLQRHFPEIQLLMIPTVRETSGLAMSSRNLLLSPEDKDKAAAISRLVLKCAEQVGHEPWPALQQMLQDEIQRAGFNSDYVALVSYPDFLVLSKHDPLNPQAICIAYHAGKVRLIDNAWAPGPLPPSFLA
ncbi:MAG: pantoate--beta-alanine ligase [Flavobacteriales bacterium]|nr:pantoate--beta-alanine ligase [Flavobacteriales bacterium]MCX7769143.1 pantoate--beta-alanine ligase [Flavobacteriales bacterium]MDW8410155.1 pantoate--beta-alanine ligase [Flavobacteriales bacterium]